VNSLFKLVEAFKKNIPFMIVDTEFNPKRDVSDGDERATLTKD
jgi:hypothetical protein